MRESSDEKLESAIRGESDAEKDELFAALDRAEGFPRTKEKRVFTPEEQDIIDRSRAATRDCRELQEGEGFPGSDAPTNPEDNGFVESKPKSEEGELHICDSCKHCRKAITYHAASLPSNCLKTKRVDRVSGASIYKTCRDIRTTMKDDTCPDYSPKPVLPPRNWRWLWLRRVHTDEKIHVNWGWFIPAISLIGLSQHFIPDDLPLWGEIGLFLFPYLGGLTMACTVYIEKTIKNG